MVEILSVAKKNEYFPNMFACLIASTKGNVFTRRCGFNDQLFGVCSPVEEEAIKVQGVGACALAGVGLSGEVDVSKARESEGFSGVYIRLFWFCFIDLCYPIIGVEMFNIVGGVGVCGFSSSLWRCIARYEE